MENCLNKYFADEFTSDEKTEFLIEVENNERLKEEFIENTDKFIKKLCSQCHIEFCSQLF